MIDKILRKIFRMIVKRTMKSGENNVVWMFRDIYNVARITHGYFDNPETTKGYIRLLVEDSFKEVGAENVKED